MAKEADINKKRAQLAEAQQAFDAQRNGQLTKLRIGLLPAGNNSGQNVNTNPFQDNLSSQLAVPVNLVETGSTYTDTVNALAEGKIDIAWLGPFSYLYAYQKYGAKVILCQLTDQGHKAYKSYIITNKKTGVKKLQELRGKQFAFVDHLSTSGNLMPRYELTQAGLDPDKDIKGIYLETHGKVLQSVLSGKFDAGAISSDVYDAYNEPDKGNIAILQRSMDIPEGPIVVSKDLQLYDTLRIEDAFLSIGEKDPAILNTMGIGGFAKATEETYQGLLDVAKKLHIDISHYE